jgi:hypothetical protein
MLRIFRHYVSGLSVLLLTGDILIVLGAFYAHYLWLVGGLRSSDPRCSSWSPRRC